MSIQLPKILDLPQRTINNRDIAKEIRGLRNDIREIEEQRLSESQKAATKSPYVEDIFGLSTIPTQGGSNEANWKRDQQFEKPNITVDSVALKKLNVI
ncbi:MAG: hypothetical protein H6622_13930 [Halobacteriovoraceae bacterium]|nr:hypothetical protein [Halobacteriovoraceae bacterium]